MKLLTYIITLVLSTTLVSCNTMRDGLYKMSDGIMFNRVKQVKTTAYTSKEKDHLKYKKKTAIGTTLQKNKSIATDWSIFPVGTKLKIGGNTYQVDDYGSALVKSTNSIPVVDIYKPTRKEMNAWGVKIFDNVEVVEWGDFSKSAEILKDRLAYKHCRTMYYRIQDNL